VDVAPASSTAAITPTAAITAIPASEVTAVNPGAVVEPGAAAIIDAAPAAVHADIGHTTDEAELRTRQEHGTDENFVG
jgi:hypothetical protein